MAGLKFAEARMDPDVFGRDVCHMNAALFHRALSDETFPDSERLGSLPASPVA
jgi:hypothetical protein